MLSTAKKIVLSLLLFTFFIPYTSLAQNELSEQDRIKYESDINDMVKYIEGTFNFLGDEEALASEKEIIISESYLKAFRDSEVQIEDDLDESRETSMNKGVQSYLQDIDFFFKNVKFTFDIESIKYAYNERKEPYFTVTLNRNLNGTDIKGNPVNNNKPRYIEISLNEEQRDLKIISFYTTKLDETADLRFWWDNLPNAWKTVLSKNIKIEGRITDTQIKNIINTEEIDISGNKDIDNLLPLSRLTKLRKVNCSNTPVNSVDGLRNLINLEVLDCSNTKIVSFDALKYTTNLRNLYLDNTLISDIQPLENFLVLQQLHMNKTLVTNLAPIEYAEELTDLRINGTQISDISILKELENIESFYANGSKISDISTLLNFKKLAVLDIGNTSISSISSLSALENLQKLTIDNTKIAEIESLSGMKSLVRIYCDNTGIKSQQASAFTQKNPKTLVMYDSQILVSWWKEMPDVWKKILAAEISLSGEPGKEELQLMANVSKIDVHGNKDITTLEPLSKLNKLEVLNIEGTPIKDLMPLLNLLDLRDLNLANTEITVLNPLLKLTKLQNLDISGTQVIEILPLKALTNLESLNMDKTKVSSITVLNDFKNLKFIYADNGALTEEKVDIFNASNPECLVIYQTENLNSWWNSLDKTWQEFFKKEFQIQDKPDRLQAHKLIYTKELSFSGDDFRTLAPLARLKWLESLSFNDTRVEDLKPIAAHKNLKSLKMPENPGINDLSPISAYSHLEVLDIQNTMVKDLKPISTIISLKILKINGTKVTSLKSLAGLKNLEQIDFFNTKVWFLKPLYSMKKIEKVKCYNTKIMKPLVKKYKEKNPTVDVVHY